MPALDHHQATKRLHGASVGGANSVRRSFNPGETRNDEGFARELANGCDLYVDDAFGSAHRAHSSTEAVARLLPAYAGLLLEEELRNLGTLLGAVVATVIIAVPLTLKDAGVAVHVAASMVAGTAQEKLTDPLNPGP